MSEYADHLGCFLVCFSPVDALSFLFGVDSFLASTAS